MRLLQCTAVTATQAIEAFQKDPPTTVFLLSMRSGSVGINLTSANYVFLLEPALNPALEEQAIGRAWRMGQQRAVHVKKLYVKVRQLVTSLENCCCVARTAVDSTKPQLKPQLPQATGRHTHEPHCPCCHWIAAMFHAVFPESVVK